nr:uncharacterized protein LOC129273021 [Lytechinus pictus]
MTDKSNSARDSFQNTCSRGSISEAMWPCGDLGHEKHDIAEKKKFPQDMPATSYGMAEGKSNEGDFDYQKEMQGLDKLSAELDSVRQQVMADILRCQLLQVDLATQFNPGLVQQLRSTKLSCEKCESTLDDSFEADINQ